MLGRPRAWNNGPSVATSPDPRSMAKRFTTPTVWLEGSATQTATCWPEASHSTSQFSTLPVADVRSSSGRIGDALGSGLGVRSPPSREVGVGLEVAWLDAVASGVGLALCSWLAVAAVADGAGTTPLSEAGTSFIAAHESRYRLPFPALN